MRFNHILYPKNLLKIFKNLPRRINKDEEFLMINTYGRAYKRIPYNVYEIFKNISMIEYKINVFYYSTDETYCEPYMEFHHKYTRQIENPDLLSKIIAHVEDLNSIPIVESEISNSIIEVESVMFEIEYIKVFYTNSSMDYMNFEEFKRDYLLNIV